MNWLLPGSPPFFEFVFLYSGAVEAEVLTSEWSRDRMGQPLTSVVHRKHQYGVSTYR